MQIICPFCSYRTDRNVTVGEVISCPWCERPFQPLFGPGEEPKPPVTVTLQAVLSASQPPPRAKRKQSRVIMLFPLFLLAVILFMPAWSNWKDSRNRADSPPGRILIAQGEVLKVVFSPDGRRLASGGGIYKRRHKWVTGEIAVWDPANGQLLLCFPGHPEGVTDLAFSPDGNRLASASKDGVKVWDAATGKQLLSLRKQPNEEPRRVVFDPEGNRLATLSQINYPTHHPAFVLQLWQAPATVEGDKKASIFSYSFPGRSSNHCIWQLPRLTFSPDGKRLACGYGTTVLIWAFSSEHPLDNTAPALVLNGHTGPVRDQVFSPDGKRLATSSDDETIRIWDPATGQELLRFDSPRDGIPGYRGIDCLAFSPDGKRLAGGKAQHLAIWDAASGTELHYLPWHTNLIESLAFSPDGKTLATGALDHEIKLWDLAALEQWHAAGHDDGTK